MSTEGYLPTLESQPCMSWLPLLQELEEVGGGAELDRMVAEHDLAAKRR